METLQKEKERLELTLSSIGDGVITTDTAGLILSMNNSAEKITQWSSSTAINRPLFQIFKVVDKDTEKPLENLLETIIKEGKITGLKKNTVLITKGKDRKYISASLSPIMFKDSITGTIIVFRDITRIKEAEERIMMERQNLLLIFDKAPIGMILVDKNRIIKKANKAILEVFGKAEKDIINKGIGDGLGCVYGNNSGKTCGFNGNSCEKCELRKALNDAISGGREIKSRYTSYKTANEERWLKINSVPIIIDGKKHAIMVIDDITKAKTAEEGLRRYRILSEHANDIIIFADITGKIIEANSAALISYGFTKEEILKRSIFDLINPDNKTPIKTKIGGVNTEGIYYEAIAKRKDGSMFFVESIMQSTIVSQERVLFSIQRDITERKQAERELKEARERAEAANYAKSEFLANMSHEIRTPLNGMLGMIDLTLLTGLTKEQKENLFIAKTCASNLLNLINDILDFSKLEAKKMKIENINFSLSEIVGEIIRPHGIKAREKNLELSYYIDLGIPENLNGDPGRIKQILNNFLDNAIKFTEIGEVKISISLKEKKPNSVVLEFKVSDTGVGIDDRDKEKIFDIFSQADSSITRKFGGTGLGLAISKELVEMMGGRIYLESQIGEGSTFSFIIELSLGELRLNDQDKAEQPINVEKPLRILLAEDDKISQIVIKRLLMENGHIVEIANNGIETLQIIEEEIFDLILMDIQMPEMDGVEAVRRIRRSEKGTGAHIPIIALTAYALKGDREKYLSSGMDGYISKPVNLNILIKTIGEVMDKTANLHNWDIDKNFEIKDLMGENFKEFKDTVINSIDAKIKMLKAIVEAKDFYNIEKLSDEIKYLGESVGMKEIKTVFFKLQLAARREDIEAVKERYKESIDTWNNVLDSI